MRAALPRVDSMPEQAKPPTTALHELLVSRLKGSESAPETSFCHASKTVL